VKTTLLQLIQKKGKVQTINYLKTWTELKESSDLVSPIIVSVITNVKIFILKSRSINRCVGWSQTLLLFINFAGNIKTAAAVNAFQLRRS
jgi:uncharacterized protein (UPF0371 family)